MLLFASRIRRWRFKGHGVTLMTLIWRPFQLGFFLLSLESSVDDSHQDRGVADLIWFPTGGEQDGGLFGLDRLCFVLPKVKI